MLIEVRESFTELQSVLDACTVLHHPHQPRGGRKETALPNRTKRLPDRDTSAIAPTKAAFAVLLEKAASHFPLTPHSPPSPPSHVTLLTPLDSLWSRLGEGLTVVLRAGQPHLAGHTTCSKVRKECAVCLSHIHIVCVWLSQTETIYMALPGRNRILFHYVIRLCYQVRSTNIVMKLEYATDWFLFGNVTRVHLMVFMRTGVGGGGGGGG